MAFPTAVNSEITDSVTQTNVQVLADAPATAMGNVYMAVAQALANSAHNATNAQQQNFALAEAVTAKCLQALLGSTTTA
ncbi:RebB family R body protein [Bradyrhizobium iriomotense]|uniref:RebB family R body protein n=1 Tax=Bradyrhizobium iriomotense TaxID=441950 RepID=UPI001B8A6A12|nr:RebB family R body protein [Bradyrhizobium iriomotense]MBR0783358.1 RebB family R body protein [Bradyrhizobium iriomotense]